MTKMERVLEALRVSRRAGIKEVAAMVEPEINEAAEWGEAEINEAAAMIEAETKGAAAMAGPEIIPIEALTTYQPGCDKVVPSSSKIRIESDQGELRPPEPSQGVETMARVATKKAATKARTRTAAKAKTASSKKVAEVKESNKKGRVSKFAGKFLYPSKDVAEENPRRNKVAGWYSLEIIRENPGIVYEEYREKGGRLNDLTWDVDRKRVEATTKDRG